MSVNVFICICMSTCTRARKHAQPHKHSRAQHYAQRLQITQCVKISPCSSFMVLDHQKPPFKSSPHVCVYVRACAYECVYIYICIYMYMYKCVSMYALHVSGCLRVIPQGFRRATKVTRVNPRAAAHSPMAQPIEHLEMIGPSHLPNAFVHVHMNGQRAVEQLPMTTPLCQIHNHSGIEIWDTHAISKRGSHHRHGGRYFGRWKVLSSGSWVAYFAFATWYFVFAEALFTRTSVLVVRADGTVCVCVCLCV